MKIFLKSFTDGLLQLLEEFGATPVSVEIAEDRLVNEIPEIDVDTRKKFEKAFADSPVVKFDYEYDKTRKCFVCEVKTRESKNFAPEIVDYEITEKELVNMVKNEDAISAKYESYLVRRQERITAGLCVHCGKRPPDPLDDGTPSIWCRECRKATHAKKTKNTSTEQLEIAVDVTDVKTPTYNKERRERLMAAGLCIECGRRRATSLKDGTPSRYCTYCRKRRNQTRKLRQLAVQKSRAKA